jgi:uncharacterized membrane protein
MKYHFATVLLMVAAIPLYVVGFALGGTLVLAAAVALEVWFWIRIVRGKSRLTAANDGR